MMGGNTRKEVYAMKAVRPYAKITVTPKGECALTGGHPWVYEGEVVSIEGAAEDGGLADVVSQRHAGYRLPHEPHRHGKHCFHHTGYPPR